MPTSLAQISQEIQARHLKNPTKVMLGTDAVVDCEDQEGAFSRRVGSIGVTMRR